MIAYNHWTPKYAIDKCSATVFTWTHPGAPWFTRDAIAILEQAIQPDHIGIEWGSGRSTIWFAERCAGIISIEHDPLWHNRVARMIDRRGLDNVTLVSAREESPGYIEPAKKIEGDILDFAIVDGRCRDECTIAVIPKLRPGGLLIIDDAHRYLAHESRSPNALGPNPDAMNPIWTRIHRITKDWACQWTTDGMRDTVIFTRPVGCA